MTAYGWPKEIHAFGRQWIFGNGNPDVAYYESRSPDLMMSIRIVHHNGWFCAGLEGDDKEGLDGALRELEEVAALMEKWPS